MKLKKYTQLLSSAAASNAAATVHNSQLQTLLMTCKTKCTSYNSTIAIMQESLQHVTTEQQLTATQLELLHKSQTDLEKISKELQKELVKPVKQIDAEVDKLKQDLQNITTQLIEPCEFDLEAVRKLIAQCNPTLVSCKQRIALCMADIQKCETEIAKLSATLQRLDLPHEIELATKHVEKAMQDLSVLNAQLNATPLLRTRHQIEFLPLRKALADLRLRDEELFPVITPAAAVAIVSTNGNSANDAAGSQARLVRG